MKRPSCQYLSMWMHVRPAAQLSMTMRCTICHSHPTSSNQTPLSAIWRCSNAVVAVKLWAPKLATKLVHLFCDNATPMAISKAGKGWEPFLQACARNVWLTCVIWVITLTVGHMAGESLTTTANALSHWHLGQVDRDKGGCTG